MEKINRHNYEAFFLDFAEGNLTAGQIDELHLFLAENQDLQQELDEFEIIEVPKAFKQSDKWDTLRKPNLQTLQADGALRDSFFLRAIEKQLTPYEEEMLRELISNKQFENEFALWERVILLSGNEKVQKDLLYQFGLDQVISENNYEYYLIARGEGLLDAKRNEALEVFAKARPNGAMELSIADRLKLSSTKGIFYPDKDRLYRKEKSTGIIWLYRVVSIAAAVLFGVFIWNQFNGNFAEKAPIANQNEQQIIKPERIDTLAKGNDAQPDTTQGNEESEEPALHEWEVREPDAAEYAYTPKKSENTEVDQFKKPVKNEIQEKTEPLEIEELAVAVEPQELIEDAVIDEEIEQNEAKLQELPNQTKTFNSVPKYAEDLMAQKLNIPDSEKDQMAMVLAKRITSKASELLDAEYTTESTGDSGDESLTYTLRIGSFKVQRTKSK